MLNNKLVLALAVATFAAAQEIESDDIPQECRAICQPVVDISDRCDFDNDQRERDCICDAANSAAFATCNECTLRYPQYFVDDDDDDDNDGNDDDDNEVNIWYNRCAFGGVATGTSMATSIGTSTGSMTSAPTAVASMSTGIYTTTVCDDDAFEDDDDDDVCTTRVVTGVVPVMATTTAAAGNTASASSSVIMVTGMQTSQTAQSTGAAQSSDSNNNSNNDSGAMAMAIPMLGAGLAVVFAAVAAF